MSKIYVTALASNNPKDKADWIEDKIDNEGYDDVYFADDSKKNVDATKKMLRGKNVKWRVQLIKTLNPYTVLSEVTTQKI